LVGAFDAACDRLNVVILILNVVGCWLAALSGINFLQRFDVSFAHVILPEQEVKIQGVFFFVDKHQARKMLISDEVRKLILSGLDVKNLPCQSTL
jgi:hypothetical protein